MDIEYLDKATAANRNYRLVVRNYYEKLAVAAGNAALRIEPYARTDEDRAIAAAFRNEERACRQVMDKFK